MSVNLLTCTASAWRGAGDLCRWCNLEFPTAGRIFCSMDCKAAYELNHRYWLGREYVLVWYTAPCDCGRGPHRYCNGCGECEAQLRKRDDRLTVNHIEPRNGIPMSSRSCIHHLDNLEPLCWRCHEQLNKLGNTRQLLDSWLEDHGLVYRTSTSMQPGTQPYQVSYNQLRSHE